MSSKVPIDPWTTAHFLVGLGSGMLQIKLKDWIFVMLLWELYEQGILSQSFPEKKEPVPNIIMDILAGAAGNKLASW